MRLRPLPKNSEQGWTPYVWLIYLGFVIMYPALGGASVLQWVLTLAGVAVFLVLYFTAHWLHDRRIWWCIAGILLLGMAFAPVNPGAQVIADGHIHIYATLRGRAVAGVQGLLGARIFCQRLEAELVAISGAYLTADDIPEARRGRPAQIHFEGGECRIAAL